MSQASDLSDLEKQRRLAELQRRLTGQRLPEDFTNGGTDTVLLRYLAARGFDVDKALAVRHPSPLACHGGGRVRKSAARRRARVALKERPGCHCAVLSPVGRPPPLCRPPPVRLPYSQCGTPQRSGWRAHGTAVVRTWGARWTSRRP